MAVPANPRLTQVCSEFGAPATTRLSAFLRGGAWVPNTPANSSVPTSLPISLSQLAGAVNLAVNLTNHSVTGSIWSETNPDPPPASFNHPAQSRIRVLAAGQLQGGGSIGGTYPEGTGDPNFTATNFSGEWLVAGSASDFECMLTVSAGSVFGSATATWLACSTDRTWTSATADTVCTLQIRPAGGGAALDSCTINLN